MFVVDRVNEVCRRDNFVKDTHIEERRRNHKTKRGRCILEPTNSSF